MRVLVTGSRDWADPAIIKADLAEIAEQARAAGDTDLVLVHGACPSGADSMAEAQGPALGYTLEPHPAKWGKYGSAAGPIRNAEMVEAGADLVLAYWRYASDGTGGTVRLAQEHGLPLRIRTAD